MKKLSASLLLISILLFGCEKEAAIDPTTIQTKTKEKQSKTGEYEDEAPIGYNFNPRVGNNFNLTNPLNQKRFDIYIPPSTQKTPLIIAFHGGGFVGGQKSDMWYPVFNNDRGGFPWLTQQNLDIRKIAYVSVSYSLVEPNNPSNPNNIFTSLNDCKKHLDFFIQNAAVFNIDPNKIVLMGFSAGASASLWLGLQNNYPQIKGLVCFDPQASLDPNLWETTIFNKNWYSKAYIRQKLSTMSATTAKLYDRVTSAERSTLHFLNLIDPTDPEVYLVSYNNPNPSHNPSDFLHHDYHIHKLINKSINVGHNKMKFMYDNHNLYYGHQYPTPETIINFCDRVTL